MDSGFRVQGFMVGTSGFRAFLGLLGLRVFDLAMSKSVSRNSRQWTIGYEDISTKG